MAKTAKTAKAGWAIGEAYILRTVTMILTGRLVAFDDHELWLEDACWIADTARWSETLRTGAVCEAEPYPDGFVAVGRGALVDAATWSAPLPREPK